MAKAAKKAQEVGSATELNFKLAREAKSNGGDRYEAACPGEEKPLVFYIPQSISRAGGAPCAAINITIQTV